MRGRVFAILASLGLAAAFVPAPRMAARSRGMARMSVQDLIGADTETGGVWDPLGLSQDDAALYKYRAVELKHGRVAMLACLGTLIQTYYQLPDAVFSNPRPLAALQQVYEQRPEAILQIIAFAGLLELTGGKQDPEKAPGDLGFGMPFVPKDPAQFSALQLKELKNGRLAQVAILGQLLQESLTGQGPIEQLLVGHISPFGDGQGFF
jgi:light-harvesting complex I chlorophyll a/b binding protein 1